MEPSVEDLETWLEFQAGQLGTPTWWEELGAVPGIEDWCKFAQKIRTSIYVPKVWLRASPERGYAAPLASQSLNRSAFLPERLVYQDVRQQPALLTIVYAWCLQHWAEKHNLPKKPGCSPLGRKSEGVVTNSVRILWTLTTRTLHKVWRWRGLRPVTRNWRWLYLVGYWQSWLMNKKL